MHLHSARAQAHRASAVPSPPGTACGLEFSCHCPTHGPTPQPVENRLYCLYPPQSKPRGKAGAGETRRSKASLSSASDFQGRNGRRSSLAVGRSGPGTARASTTVLQVSESMPCLSPACLTLGGEKVFPLAKAGFEPRNVRLRGSNLAISQTCLFPYLSSHRLWELREPKV